MRDLRENFVHRRKGVIGALILSVLLVFNPNHKANADIYQPKPLAVLMVGVKAQELAVNERGILNGKRVLEVPRTDNWQKSIESTGASEIIVKQNTGFVGLYTPSGILLKSVEMADHSNPANQGSSSPIQTLTYQEEQDFGYRVGGRIDPYKPLNVYEPKNNARLSAGWGYNSNQGNPSTRRGAISRFLEFSPIDTVTPLNYPGYFDQRGLTTAYGLGVIPHIGGLIAAKMKAKEENDYYNELKVSSGVPNYTEQPVTYYRNDGREPDNPIVTDPNFLRLSPMPQAFNQQYPGYGNNFRQY